MLCVIIIQIGVYFDEILAFFINGGAGRVIVHFFFFFINYEKENPQDDFIIVCEGGMDFYKISTLHKRAFDNWHKNLYEEKLNKEIV